MREMYLLISILFFEVMFFEVRANDPNQNRNLAWGYENNKPGEAGVSSLVMQNAHNANRPVHYDLNAASSLEIYRANNATGVVTKGMRAADRVLETLNSIVNRGNIRGELSMGKRRASQRDNTPEIVDFLNSLSRLAARYRFNRNCTFFGKLQMSSQFVDLGLNF